jgi:hypothetical protein
MESQTTTLYPIVAILAEAEKVQLIKSNPTWQPKNDLQAEFLAKYYSDGRADIKNIPEIESIASWKVEEVNEFLRSRGYNFSLQPTHLKSLAVASILNLLVNWTEEGEATTIKDVEEKEYPAVRLPDNHVAFYSSLNHGQPIACLQTKSGDEVFLTIQDEPLANFQLLEKIQLLSQSFRRSLDYSGIIFPMVDYDRRVDISWLLKISTLDIDNNPVFIDQIIQQTTLKMNEKGARVKSVVAASIVFTASADDFKPYLIIDKPFLIWFRREGLSLPLFAGYMTQEDWKKPANLD